MGTKFTDQDLILKTEDTGGGVRLRWGGININLPAQIQGLRKWRGVTPFRPFGGPYHPALDTRRCAVYHARRVTISV